MYTKRISIVILCCALTAGCEKFNWEEALKTNTRGSYQKYLKEYPKGNFVAAANEGLEKLAFEAAEEANTKEALQSFLKEYPKGKLASSAEASLNALVVAEIQADFDKVRQENSVHGYLEFIDRVESKQFRQQAKTELDKVFPAFAPNKPMAFTAKSTMVNKGYCRISAGKNPFDLNVELDGVVRYKKGMGCDFCMEEIALAPNLVVPATFLEEYNARAQFGVAVTHSRWDKAKISWSMEKGLPFEDAIVTGPKGVVFKNTPDGLVLINGSANLLAKTHLSLFMQKWCDANNTEPVNIREHKDGD